MSRDPTNPFAPLDNPGWLDSRNPERDHSGSIADAGLTSLPSGSTAPPPASSEPADWSGLPRDLYVTSVRRLDNVVWEATVCSVPMAIGPEVRYSRAEAALEKAREALTALRKLLPHEDLGAVGLFTYGPFAVEAVASSAEVKEARAALAAMEAGDAAGGNNG